MRKTYHLSRWTICLIGYAALRAPAVSGEGPAPVQPVEVRIGPSAASIGNRFLTWKLSLTERRVATTEVVNRRTGEPCSFKGEDFLLELGDGRRIGSSQFELDSAFEEPAPGGGRRLVVQLARGELRVNLVTQLMQDQWWATRWLEISDRAGALAAVNFSQWRCAGARGPEPPATTGASYHSTLGLPNGLGQPVACNDLFLAIAHPGAQNVQSAGGVSFRLPCYDRFAPGGSIRTREFILGAAPADGVRRAFLGYIDATRATPARMICLVNDWYWKDKSRPIEAIRALVQVKQETGIPIDSLTLDEGWDTNWDASTGLWGRLDPVRFPGGWESVEAAARPADIAVSLWFGPIGGYSLRAARLEIARKFGFEVNGDKLCLAGPRYHSRVAAVFADWARRGMDYIKVDGFWPNCPQVDHGHLVGERGRIQQMDALIAVFDAWRRERGNLVIGYTSGSNPSPFWLQHCEFVWRGGVDDAFAGAGEPFDRYATFIDGCLQQQRDTELPPSAAVTFDIVQDRVRGSSDAAFERNAWWLAARTSLHHDWYVQAADLTTERWRLLARTIEWAKTHARAFRFSRMVGGDPRQGQLYGFAADDMGAGTLALRNPAAEPRRLETTLADLLDLSTAERSRSVSLRSVYGPAGSVATECPADASWRIELPPLGVALFEFELR